MPALVKVNAGNDSCGNPRRGWIVVRPDGQWEAFVPEGYIGRQAPKLAGYGPGIVHTYAHDGRELLITPGMYRELRKLPSSVSEANRD